MAVTPRLTIEEEFRQRFASSAALADRARQVFPRGVTHDARYFDPFSLYVQRAQGIHKWDVDGHQLVDCWMGHGALLLGHNHPKVVAAVQEQLARGTHYGASHELEIRWGELVCQLVPSVERIEFTSSGTEATLMALRLARAYTGRSKIVKFRGHFHGWHDYATAAVQPPFDVPMSSGVPGETLSTVLVAEPNDIASVRSLLDQHDVAAVILEPGGGSNSVVPTRPEFLKQLRDLTRERGVVLIFDEVISGFRFAPGGAQEHYGVVPDMTTMAKILAGGLPGGAVGGRQEILDVLSMKKDPPDWNRGRRIAHPGTFNANPLSSAAGVACLEIVATGEPHRVANRLGGDLRRGFNEVLQRRGVVGHAYGECSVFHVALGLTADDVAKGDPSQLMQARPVGAKLRKAMLLEGVDLMRTGGFVSGVHTESDIAFMVEAFDRAVARMQEEGAL